MNYAIIDIGSNTIRLNIYHVTDAGFSMLMTKKNMAGLANYMEKGCLSQDGIDRLTEVLSHIQNTLRSVATDKIYYFATASLRKAANRDAIIAHIKKQLDIAIELIDEKKEAELGYLGLRTVYDKEEGLSVDIGGGSTELVQFKGHKTQQVINIDQGSLSLYSDHIATLLPTKDEIQAIKNAALPSGLKIPASVDGSLIGIGGTVRAAGKSLRKLYPGEPDRFTANELKALIKRIRDQDTTAIRAILKAAPERIHTLTPGMLLLSQICKKAKVSDIIICHNGVREGYLIDKLKENGHGYNSL